MAKKYDAGVKEYRETYWMPDYTPKDTDILACFKITPQPGVPREEAAAAVAKAERGVKNVRYYEGAREFARIVSSTCQVQGLCEYVVVTGGGPGIWDDPTAYASASATVAHGPYAENLPVVGMTVEAVRRRTRPIAMSALTSLVGLLPLVIFPGSGSELYRALGSVVVGGLLVSTVFTLFLVPVVYAYMDRIGTRLRGKREKHGRQDVVAEEA